MIARIRALPQSAVLAGIAAVSVAAVAIAATIQHTLGYQPCAWCVLQRLIFLVIAAAAVLGLLWRSVTGQRLAGVLMASTATSGMAAALWQHFVAAASQSCDLSLADRIVAGLGLDAQLPWLFAAYASCADAAAKLLGIYFEFYSLTLFTLIAVASVWVLARSFNPAFSAATR